MLRRELDGDAGGTVEKITTMDCELCGQKFDYSARQIPVELLNGHIATLSA